MIADVVRGSRQGSTCRLPRSVLPGGTGPPHPHAPALREHLLDRGHESPRRAPEAGAFGPPFRGERQPVRNDDEGAIVGGSGIGPNGRIGPLWVGGATGGGPDGRRGSSVLRCHEL